MKILSEVHDPEIPVLNIVEMGIVRNVEFSEGRVNVEITPTYSGCPAMKVIEDDIVTALNVNGFTNINVNIVYSPVWTTEWLSSSTKQKLKDYGIAPPRRSEDEVIILLPRLRESVACPFCGSKETELRSEFGSTACKSFYYCNNCKQPFEYFKEI
ncbi:MAG: 1,2-phenylacetyl-CoA epoxidase subunit PaaD [Bacteroidota bacterium]